MSARTLRFFALLAIVCVPATTGAYVRTKTSTGTPIAWNGTCASMMLSREENPTYASHRLHAAFDAVIAAWETQLAGCARLNISLADDPTEISEIEYDGTNLVRWRLPGACADPEQADSEICRSPNAAAITTVFFIDRPGDPRNGELLEADIELNAIAFEFDDDGDPARMDMQNTLSHELGHVMGLDHTCYTLRGGVPPIDSHNDLVPFCYPLSGLTPAVTETTMFNFAAMGETKKRRPGTDEVIAVCELYAAQPTTCSVAIPAGCGCQLTGNGRTSLVVGFIMAGLVWMPLRARKRTR